MKIIIVVFLFCACSTPAKDKGEEKVPEKNIRYRDIDVSAMKGVDEQAGQSQYPYIMIDGNENKKRIVYQFSFSDSTVREYEKVNDRWFTSFHSTNNTLLSIRSYEFIFPEKIYELKYRDSILFSASDFRKDHVYTYSFYENNGLKIDPFDPKAFEWISETAPIVITDTMELNGDILKITTKSIDRLKNKINFTDTSCFNGGMHSWFWFRHFIGKLKPCP